MKGLAASAVLLAVAGCAGPAATTHLDARARGQLAELLERGATPAVSVAALVVDLDTGETLVARDAARLLRPASTMKVLTTATVCRRAADEAVRTTLSAGATEGGTVTLTGGADPFLTSEDLAGLVAGLRTLGLEGCRAVRVVDPLAGAPRFGEGWMWDDEPDSFMPALSAAAVDGGCVTVEATGTDAGLEARLAPSAGGLRLVVEPGPGRLRATRGRYADPDLVTVSGGLPSGDADSRRLTVPDPAAYAGWVLADALARAGLLQGAATVAVVPPSAADASALSVTRERSVEELVEATNKASDNLGAELLLRLASTFGEGAPPLGPGSLEASLALLREDVRALGLDPGGYRIADGSGVSHYTLVSAELLVRTLVDMHARGGRAFEAFERSLPIAGVDGTLSNRMKGTAAEGRVRAKTGTISGVSNLAGYVATRSGRRLAFAVLVQNFVGPSAPWRALQDEFCAALAEL